MDITDLLKLPDVSIAIVGANNNPAKYGSVIYSDLKRKGYTLYPINPNQAFVDGDRAYASLKDLPVKPTIVNFVTAPAVTLNIMKECETLGLKNVWVQPGAESPEVMLFMQTHEFNYLANACIMVESRIKK